MRKQSIYSSRILSRSSRPTNAPTDREGNHGQTTTLCRAEGRNRRLAIYACIIALILACLILPCATKRCATPPTGGRTIGQPLFGGLTQGIKRFARDEETAPARNSIRGFLKPKQLKKELDANKKPQPKEYDKKSDQKEYDGKPESKVYDEKSELKKYDKNPEPKVYDFGTKLELITDPNAK